MSPEKDFSPCRLVLDVPFDSTHKEVDGVPPDFVAIPVSSLISLSWNDDLETLQNGIQAAAVAASGNCTANIMTTPISKVMSNTGLRKGSMSTFTTSKKQDTHDSLPEFTRARGKSRYHRNGGTQIGFRIFLKLKLRLFHMFRLSPFLPLPLQKPTKVLIKLHRCLLTFPPTVRAEQVPNNARSLSGKI